MNSVRIPPRLRLIFSRLSSLLLLCQRSPIITLIFPEAKILGGSAIADTATLAIATVVGLGAYDSVSGATSVVQVLPLANNVNVPTAIGIAPQLNFVYRVSTNVSETPVAFHITSGTLPTGLTKQPDTTITSKTQTISGVPTQSGVFPITIEAWSNTTSRGSHWTTGSFTIFVLGFTTQPAATKSINSGSTTTLTCAVTGVATGATVVYQWYQGTAGTTTTPVGTNSATLTTPALTVATNYWVKVTSTLSTSAVSINSTTSAISVVGTVPAGILSSPAPSIANYGDVVPLTVTANGSLPLTYQWYRGTYPDASTPVGTNSATFNTPALTANTSFWVKVTNTTTVLNTATSSTATITVRNPFDSWMFTSGVNVPSNQNGPWDAPQHDGVPSILRFAFNLDPNISDLRRLTVGGGGTAGFPGMSRVGGKLRIEFIRRKATTNPGISYTPQCSMNLTTWTPLTTGLTVTAIAGTTVWERVVVDGPAGQPTCIGRVVVDQLP